jgi:hypothetical protein
MRFARRQLLKRGSLALIGAAAVSPVEILQAQKSAPKADDCNCTQAADGSPLDNGTSEVRPVIERYSVELRDYERVYPLAGSAARQAALEKFYTGQLRLLDGIRFDDISQSGKVYYLLLRSRLLREQKALLAEKQSEAEIAPLIPFQQKRR